MIKFLVCSLVAAACLVGFVVAGAGYFLLSTPRPTNIKECFTTEMFKVRLCPSEAGYVKLRDISPNVRNAIIVSEDGAFYTHHGIDWFELQESVNKNWEKGEFARGGSTITQQLAKNVYLSSEKSLLRKAREALIAIQLEERLTKDEILEKYLNVVEFGDGIYGVGKASRAYFQKPPSQLTIAESAFLAFLLPSPKKYSVSYRKKQLTPFARTQMKMIVNRLHNFKKISEEERVEALAQVDHFYGGPIEPLLESGAPPAGDAGEGPGPEEDGVEESGAPAEDLLPTPADVLAPTGE